MDRRPGTNRRTQRTAVAAALVAVLLVVVACANTIAGSAVADQAAALTAGTYSSTSDNTSSGTATSPDTAISANTPTSVPVTEDTATDTNSQTGNTGTAATGTEDTATSGTGAAPTSTGSTEFPTTPHAYPEYPQSAASAAVLEGRRMSAYVLLPSDWNPAYIDGSGIFPAAPMKNGQALSQLFFDSPVPAVATRYKMIAGFYTSRNKSNTDGDGLVVAVMEFGDAKNAATAAKQLGAAAKTAQDTKAAAIPGYTGAVGWSGTYPEQNVRYTQTFLASATLVIYVWTESSTGSTRDLPEDIAGVYAKQLALLKGFTPTPKSQLMKQKLDPNGLLARTLPPAEDNATVINGNYTARGFLHFTLNPPADQKLYPLAGVDVVTENGSTLYRARDSDGAAMVVDDFVKQIGASDPKMTQMTPPDGADYAKCLQNTLAATYYCVAAYGRYAVEISQGTETAMAAAVSAQGKLLDGA